jgi:hypothetical protein
MHLFVLDNFEYETYGGGGGGGGFLLLLLYSW